MVRQPQRNGMLTGLADNLVPHGLVILQYADDSIVCLKENIDNARNMMLLLYIYELGLTTNCAKSEVILLIGDDNLCLKYAELFDCHIGTFPLKYLGAPASPGRLHVRDWTLLEEKNEKKLASRTTLIDSSISNSFVYHMSMYLLPQKYH